MEHKTHGNGKGLNDLYLLPKDEEEKRIITNFLKNEGRSFRISYSDVIGQSWWGKYFIEILFGEFLLPQIKAALN